MMQMATGVFLLNYNLHTDDDWKGNSGNGNGNNKDNSGSGNNGKGNSGNNGNGNGNGKGNGNNKKNSKSGGTDDAGYGNATNAEENNSQNQCGILFPVQEEVSATEADLIARIKTTGKEKNYELIEYLNDVNREHAEVLVEQNINGRTDTSYIYGAEINGGFDRISLDRFDGSTDYYLYDARGSVSGVTNEEGQVYQSYRYSVTGEITFGAPQYENEYTYNGESYNPNIQSQYLRARYYCVVTATFLTEDSYLGNQTEPLTLNRYNYCVSSYLNYTDPSGNEVEVLESLKGWIIDPDTQAQKTIENYENQRLSIEDAIERGLLNNRAGQIFLDYGDVIMGPPVTLPSSLVGIREAIKGNFDSKEMQRTATAGFYAGFVGQGLEYVQIISKADYQLSLLIVTQKGLNAAANPLTYVEYFRNFSPQEKLEAAKRTAKGAWNGEYDSALGRKTGAAILDYLLVAIGGALMKGESAACEVAESGSYSGTGEYGDVGGHHVHAKAGFKDDVNYDPKKGFSISQNFMRDNGLDHNIMTSKQRELFKELYESGRPNTLEEHTRIAREALKAGGASDSMIDDLINASLRNLREQGVTAPTRIPWYSK